MQTCYRAITIEKQINETVFISIRIKNIFELIFYHATRLSIRLGSMYPLFFNTLRATYGEDSNNEIEEF